MSDFYDYDSFMDNDEEYYNTDEDAYQSFDAEDYDEYDGYEHDDDEEFGGEMDRQEEENDQQGEENEDDFGVDSDNVEQNYENDEQEEENAEQENSQQDEQNFSEGEDYEGEEEDEEEEQLDLYGENSNLAQILSQNSTRQTPCRYGIRCRFLRQQTCRFYHPPEHLQTALFEHRALIFSSLFAEEPQHHSQSSNSQITEVQMDRFYSQPHIQHLYQQIHDPFGFRLQQSSRQQPQRRIEKEYEYPFEWYFSKNKTIKISQLSNQVSLQDQCSVCCSSLMEENHPQVKPEVRGVNPQNKEEQGQEITELFCKHRFHKQCIRRWLFQPKHLCPICRVDFRDHAEYSNAKPEVKQSRKEESSHE